MKRLLLILWLFLAPSLMAQSTQERLPTGQGTYDNWAGDPEAVEHLNVDEYQASPNDSDFMYKADSVGVQTHTFTAFDITSASITNVTVYFRCRESAGETEARAYLYVNGTGYAAGVTEDLTGSFANYSYAWTDNPDTSSAWTEADVEGAGSNPLEEFGVQNQATVASEEVECSQNSILVTYTEAAAGGANRMLLLGVGP